MSAQSSGWAWISRSLVAGALLVYLVGCVRAMAKDELVIEPRAILSAAWDPHRDHVRVDYTVNNRGEVPIVVFDRLFRSERSGSRTIDPHLAFTSLSAEGYLIVEKLVPAIPDHLDVESPLVPYGRVVPAGGELVGSATIPAPVKLYVPYAAGRPQPKLETATAVVLRIGVAAIDDDAAPRPIESEGGVVYALRHDWASQRQRVLASTMVRMAVPIAQQ